MTSFLGIKETEVVGTSIEKGINLYTVPDINELIRSYNEIKSKDLLNISDVVKVWYIDDLIHRFIWKDHENLKTEINIEKDFGCSLEKFMFKYLNIVKSKESLSDCFSMMKTYREKKVLLELWGKYGILKKSNAKEIEDFLNRLDKNYLYLVCHSLASKKLHKEVVLDFILSDWKHFPLLYRLIWPCVGNAPSLNSGEITENQKHIAKDYILNANAKEQGYNLNLLLQNKNAIKCFNIDPLTIKILRTKVNEYFSFMMRAEGRFRVYSTIDDQLSASFDCIPDDNGDAHILINPIMMEEQLQQSPYDIIASFLFFSELNQFGLAKQKYNEGIIEALATSEENQYKQNFVREGLELISLTTLKLCDLLLKENGNDYLQMLVNYIEKEILPFIASDDIHLKFGQNEHYTSYKSKAVVLFSNINSLIRLYRLFIESGGIRVTREVAQNSFFNSSDPLYSEIPSGCEFRHVYLDEENLTVKEIKKVLFSTVLEVDDEEIHTCCDWLIKRSAKEEIPDFLLDKIKLLETHGILHVENNKVHLQNFLSMLLAVLDHLNTYSEMQLSFDDIKIYYALDFLFQHKWIKSDSNLFSKDEIDYLNYILTDRDFSNNMGLRNLYCHGGSSFVSEEKAIKDYYHGLIALSFMALAIDNDLKAIRNRNVFFDYCELKFDKK